MIGLLGACSSTPLERTVIRGGDLPPRTALPDLACGYRLETVLDRRIAGDTAGSLGAHAFTIDSADALVRQRLQAHGFIDEPTLPAVSIEVRQLYIIQNQTSKVPVAVYRVIVDDDPPITLRSRSASMNWNGTEAESQRAIARALDDADAQLLQVLNTRCDSRVEHRRVPGA